MHTVCSAYGQFEAMQLHGWFKFKVVEYAENHGNHTKVHVAVWQMCALNRVCTNPHMTDLKYECDLYSGKHGTQRAMYSDSGQFTQQFPIILFLLPRSANVSIAYIHASIHSRPPCENVSLSLLISTVQGFLFHSSMCNWLN